MKKLLSLLAVVISVFVFFALPHSTNAENYSNSKSPFIINKVIGLGKSYAPNDRIAFQIEVLEKINDVASKEEGFNVQVYINDPNNRDKGAIEGVNAQYDYVNKLWNADISVPSVKGKYEVEVVLYCSNLTTGYSCYDKYGDEDNQIVVTKKFKVKGKAVIDETNNQSITIVYPELTNTVVKRNTILEWMWSSVATKEVDIFLTDKKENKIFFAGKYPNSGRFSWATGHIFDKLNTPIPNGSYTVSVCPHAKSVGCGSFKIEITGTDTDTKLGPKINRVAGVAAYDFEVYSGEKTFIEGSNLVYEGKDTRVFIGGKEGKVTQYNDKVVFFTAPVLERGNYDLYVTTTKGKSDSVRVKVNASSTTTEKSIMVISPNGGEVFEVGKKYTIKWDSRGLSKETDVSLELEDTSYANKGDVAQHYSPILGYAKTIKNTGSYEWLVPTTLGNGSMVLGKGSVYGLSVGTVKGNINDGSDKVFSIVSRVATPTPATGANTSIGGTSGTYATTSTATTTTATSTSTTSPSLKVISPVAGTSKKAGDTVVVRADFVQKEIPNNSKVKIFLVGNGNEVQLGVERTVYTCPPYPQDCSYLKTNGILRTIPKTTATGSYTIKVVVTRPDGIIVKDESDPIVVIDGKTSTSLSDSQFANLAQAISELFSR